GQGKKEDETEKRQGEIKKSITDMQEATVGEVNGILKDMATEIRGEFETKLKGQTKIFNDNVRERISSYYGRFRIDDKLFGPADIVVFKDGTTRSQTTKELLGLSSVTDGELINPDVYRIFTDEKGKFLDAMDIELDRIAHSVEERLTKAAKAISDGEAKIAGFKNTLSG